MTEAEKKEIVALVMSEISGQAVDFDLQTVTPQRTDILPAVRPYGEGGYTGVTLDWGGITDELTTQAKGFRDEALQAKRDTAGLKSDTQAIKEAVENAVSGFNDTVEQGKKDVQEIYSADLDKIKEKVNPIDFRVTDPNKVILDVDVTGTMGAFMDGMEQEPNEAIALTLEPDVPTAGSHNFGVRGQICIDGNYLYVCVADNTWKKIPLQEL